MQPRMEHLLDRVDSKFTLVTLAAMRAREINDYYNQLGEGLGKIVPPQVTSVSRKPLTISLEEIEAGKIEAVPLPAERDEDEAQPPRPRSRPRCSRRRKPPAESPAADPPPPGPCPHGPRRRPRTTRSPRCEAGASCSASAAGSPPTRRSTSAAAWSTPARTSMPVLTDDALRFVGALTFSALASEPARTSLFDAPEPIPHTRLGQTADLVVVAPATAKLLGKYAAGISDDLLTATLLATRAPVLVAPAMHTEMWEHPAVQENLATLRAPRRARGRPRVRAPRRRRRRRGPARRPRPHRRGRGGGARRAATSPACASWSPRAARASRSTRCGSSGTGRRGRWVTPSPRPRRAAARRSRSSPPSAGPRRRSVEVVTGARPPSEMADAVLAAFADVDAS